MQNMIPSAGISEDAQVKLRAGISIYEIRSIYRRFFAYSVMGPVDVKVQENDMAGPIMGQMQHSITWQTKYRAGVRFELMDRKRGNCICWMPEDPFWRNRIFLMDNGFLYHGLYALHTPSEGMIPAGTVHQWINIMREFLKEKVPIWRVFINNKERSFHYTKESAQAEIAHLKYEDSRTQIVGQQLESVQGKIFSTDIQEGFRLQYRAEIRKLIMDNKRKFEFGWTQCPEFQANIKPAIENLIKEKTTEVRPSLISDLLNATVKLTDEEKAIIRQRLGVPEPDGTEVPPDDGQMADPDTDAAPAAAQPSPAAADPQAPAVKKRGPKPRKREVEEVS